MYKSKKNSCLIRLSDNTPISFSLLENNTLVYMIYKNEKWSAPLFLTDDCSSDFSIQLLPNDKIQIIFKDTHDNVMLMSLIDELKSTHKLLENKDTNQYELKLRSIFYNMTTFVFFSIFDKTTKNCTIIYQKLTEYLKLTDPIIIDTIYSQSIIPFSVFLSDFNTLYVFYENFLTFPSIGYRILHTEDTTMSNFIPLTSNDYLGQPLASVNINTIKEQLNYFHENIISKEKALTELEALLISKQKEIDQLKEKISTKKLPPKPSFFSQLFKP